MESSYPGSRFGRPSRRTARYVGDGAVRLLSEPHPTPMVITPRGDMELSSGPIMAYEPPKSSLDRWPENEPVPLLLYHDDHSHRIVNRNPARDLAFPCLSHGCCCLQCARTQEIGFVENCGRFERMVGPGLHLMLWPVNTVGGRVSLRIQQLDVTCETKTADHVFCHVTISILYRVCNPYEAFYRLVNPTDMIQNGVLSAVRATIPTRISLDELFSRQSELSQCVITELQGMMREYGYEIMSTLITNIEPNEVIKQSMNEISASRRLKEASRHQGDAAKLEAIAHAQAMATRKAYLGRGIARERESIARGMRESVQEWTELDVRITRPPDASKVMELLLVVQYLDLIQAIGANQLQVYHNAVTQTSESTYRVGSI